MLFCLQSLTLSDLSLDYKLFKAETIFYFPGNSFAILLHYINTGEHFKTPLAILYATMFICPAKGLGILYGRYSAFPKKMGFL